MIGQILYIAPELRAALHDGRPAVPDLRSHLFAFGVLMHEVVLLLHPAVGANATPEEFEKAMTNGWVHDPARTNRPKGAGGVPCEAVYANLHRLFRLSLSPHPDERPLAIEWETALLAALKSVHICDACSMPFLVDPSKTACPACGAKFPDWQLTLTDGRVVRIAEASVLVGRDTFGGNMKVSQRHAIFRKIGPELHLESQGRNGTWRRNGHGCVRLPDRAPILLSPNDRLRIGSLRIRKESSWWRCCTSVPDSMSLAGHPEAEKLHREIELLRSEFARLIDEREELVRMVLPGIEGRWAREIGGREAERGPESPPANRGSS